MSARQPATTATPGGTAAPTGTVLYRRGVIHEPGRGRAASTTRSAPGAPAPPAATALLVTGDTIAWTGTETAADLIATDPAVDAVVDLDAALLAPAFVDAHVHATATGLALGGLDLAGCATLADALDTVARAAAAAPGATLLGTGWDETRWPERRPPSAAELDRAAAGAQVYLARVDGHSAVVSTSLAHHSGAPELPGWLGAGLCHHDAHHAARATGYATISPGQRRDAWRLVRTTAARHGIVALHEMAGPEISSADDLAGLLTFAESEPGPRLVGYWAGDLATATALGVGLGGDAFVDGSLGSHTAALRAPYTDHPHRHPAPLLTEDDVRDAVLGCWPDGRQAGFHAIGDAALDVVLAGLWAAVDTIGLGPVAAARHRIEHCELVHPDQITQIARLGLIASVQPAFDATWGGPAGMYAERLGADRGALMNPFAALAAAGVPLALSSDAPVTPLDPWGGVRAAVAHRTHGAGLSAHAAFDAATRGGWYAARAEATGAGTLAAGHPATFAVWRRPAGADPSHGRTDERADVPSGPADLNDLGGPAPQCLRTVLDGVVLFDALDASRG